MEHTVEPRKHGLELPSPKTLARLLGVSYKKQKTSQVPRSLDDANNVPVGSPESERDQDGGIRGPDFSSLSTIPIPPLPSLSNTNAPALHSVPSSFVPILHPNAKASDFFSDLAADLGSNQLTNQTNGILSRFPPPLPPFIPTYGGSNTKHTSDDMGAFYDETGGIMVPFIYPRPPVIDVTRLPYSVESLRRKQPVEAVEAAAAAPQAESQPPATPATPATRGRKRKEKATKGTQFTDAYRRNNALDAETTNLEDTPTKTPAETVTETATTSGTGTESKSNDATTPAPNPNNVYLEIPPLPFPPPNYMPYPLLAHKSYLTPGAVFEAFMDANENLPRIDMVVASAAGSLFDIKDQASKEGFEIEEHENGRKLKKEQEKRDAEEQELQDESPRRNLRYKRKTESSQTLPGSQNDSRVEEEEEEDDDSEFNDYCDYISNINTEDHFDPHENTERNSNTVEVHPRPSEHVVVKSALSAVRGSQQQPEVREGYDQIAPSEYTKFFTEEPSTSSVLPVASSLIITSHTKDVTSANGNNKEKRRQELLRSSNELESYVENNRQAVYESRRAQLLNRLKNLQQSKLSFTKSNIKDDELLKFKERLDITRDEELVRLKMVENYELLKNSLTFYQDSNKAYKSLNSVKINKLEKLKNFFEYQRNLFNEYLKDDNHDIFDVKTKDSSKLFFGVSERDYAHEMKELVKKSLMEEVSQSDLDNFEKIQYAKKDFFTLPPPVSLSTPSTIPPNVSVHDLMPLITPDEVNIITGDIRSKAAAANTKDNKSTTGGKQSINLKHQIFQSPLYDRVTSGSDTNVSDSNSSSAVGNTAKRRGRRSNAAPGGSNQINGNVDKFKSDGPDSKYSEATLLARIMKQFSGPQMAKTDELSNDLEMMGLKSKWPVSK